MVSSIEHGKNVTFFASRSGGCFFSANIEAVIELGLVQVVGNIVFENFSFPGADTVRFGLALLEVKLGLQAANFLF